ncbi:unnamed protein product [Amoebophrya sp. A25]|nr:unnamed protein product [Amoebophrya sp. A25]|eukprot:GSA25T00007143001.1
MFHLHDDDEEKDDHIKIHHGCNDHEKTENENNGCDKVVEMENGNRSESEQNKGGEMNTYTRTSTKRTRTLTIVDLAGSERSLDTFANRGEGMLETKFISTSLAALHDCVCALAASASKSSFSTFGRSSRSRTSSSGGSSSSRGGHQSSSAGRAPNWRASKLTMLLKDRLLQLCCRSSPSSSSSLLWISHFSPMSWDSPYSRRTAQTAKSLARYGQKMRTSERSLKMASTSSDYASRDPATEWTKKDVVCWLRALDGEGKYENLVDFFSSWADGPSLRREWKYDLARRVAAYGGTEEQGCEIYEKFEQEMKKYKKANSNLISSKITTTSRESS